MAYVKTWSTKEEVLKDLAIASGGRTRKKDDLDSSYLVIGDVPPPVIPEYPGNIIIEDSTEGSSSSDESKHSDGPVPLSMEVEVNTLPVLASTATTPDLPTEEETVAPYSDATEMEIRFGGAASGMDIYTEEVVKPDLAGIQQMLRMVQGYNSGDDENTDDTVNEKEFVIAITKVSKLNPEVEEFKPKQFTSPSPSRNSNKYSDSPRKKENNSSSCLSNKDIKSNVFVQSVDVKTEESQTETEDVKGKESGDNNHLDVGVNADENENANIATILKKQISDTKKSDSYELKKQKNVAIATLLRLYAKNNTEEKCAAPIKLIKPEYFEGKVEIPAVKVEKALDIVTPATSSTPEPRDGSTTLVSSSTFSISPSSSSPKIKLDPEIKKSIDKVNKWLGEPTKSQSPAVCLGPIEFKRKEPKISCKSPSSESASRPPKPAVQSKKYQPSKYAEELQKEYLERHKALESKQKEIMWHNLEDVLKEKDFAIRKRLEEQAEQGPASTSDP